jgi:hypothetical protein
MVFASIIITPADTKPSVALSIRPEDLKILFQRALNTWTDVPPYLLELSDKLDVLCNS